MISSMIIHPQNSKTLCTRYINSVVIGNGKILRPAARE